MTSGPQEPSASSSLTAASAGEGVPPARSPRSERVIVSLFFAVAFVLFAVLFLRMPLLNDSDSYYHLAVARLYAQHGIFARIPWARFSLLAAGGDKELLFHLLLIPFVTLVDPLIGGRLALALFNATVATILGWRAHRAIGAAGFFVPLVLWLAAPPFVMRIVRLRPEWLALIVILAAVTMLPRRHRDRWLGVLSFLFALSYTAFHVFLALCFFWIVCESWQEAKRTLLADAKSASIMTNFLKRSVGRFVWPAAGAVAALLLHPYPLQLLRLWYVQNVVFFLEKNRLNVGVEIRPPSLPGVVTSSLGWLLAIGWLLYFAKSRASGGPAELGEGRTIKDGHEYNRRTGDQDRNLTRITDRSSGVSRMAGGSVLSKTVVAACLFAILFVFMTRMATYAFPLVTLAAIEVAAVAKRRPRTSIVLAGVTACCLLGLPGLVALRPVRFLLDGARVSPERGWAEFGRAVPAGARVATDWQTGEHYAFWAPQGRYLNVLEPLFMARPYPAQYTALRRIYEGREPDVPGTVKTMLASDYFAADLSAVHPILLARLRNDPRLVLLHEGTNALYRIESRPERFVRDWNGVTSPDFVAIDAHQLVDDNSSALPRGSAGRPSRWKTEVGGCVTFRHLEPPRAVAQTFELAPYGPSTLTIDGRPVTSTHETRFAVLGAGYRFQLMPAAVPQVIEVTSCRAIDGVGGFYLLRR